MTMLRPPSARPVQNARRNCQKPPTILDGCLIAPTYSPKTHNGTNSVAIAEEERQLRFQKDPIWRDSLLLYEYFHGETGEGLGASHQTGWTALAVALGATARSRHVQAAELNGSPQS
jgi:poly(3-hydroxybutyrate) depolymerase